MNETITRQQQQQQQKWRHVVKADGQSWQDERNKCNVCSCHVSYAHLIDSTIFSRETGRESHENGSGVRENLQHEAKQFCFMSCRAADDAAKVIGPHGLTQHARTHARSKQANQFCLRARLCAQRTFQQLSSPLNLLAKVGAQTHTRTDTHTHTHTLIGQACNARASTAHICKREPQTDLLVADGRCQQLAWLLFCTQIVLATPNLHVDQLMVVVVVAVVASV